MAQNPRIIGLISDTHGLLRDEALEALKDSELIIHAGDVGKPEVIDRLEKTAQVIAVRETSTVDPGSSLPLTAVVEAGPVKFYVVHNLQDLDVDPVTAGFQFVIGGHTHKAECTHAPECIT